MRNAETSAAWSYHDATKHSVASLQRDAHALDWANEPLPYKLYPTLAALPLPRDWATPPMDALTAIGTTVAPTTPRVPTVAELARVMLLSAGVVRKVVYANGREMYFRAAACTGALYHVDVYVVCGDLPGLEAGVYHFGPHDFALRQLRAGDHRRVLVDAAGGETAVAAAPVVLVSTSTVWRNAWKYRARAYRHCWWDDGTLLANALAAATAAELPARVVIGFVDAAVDVLLGLDGSRELALSLLALGRTASPPPPPPEVAPLALETVAASAREIIYPAIAEIHAASALRSDDEVRAWRNAVAASATRPSPPASPAPANPSAPSGGARTALRPRASGRDESIDDVIRRRGSTRVFAREAIGFEQLSTVLATATRDLDGDFSPAPSARWSELYLIVHAVEGLAPGTYRYDRARQSLTLLRAGELRRDAGFLALGQDLAASASVNCYLLADLHRALAGLGNRGYRACQLEAAITGGRLYLAAYALGLGATGLTFLDDAVTDFFAPDAIGKSVMFLVAMGRHRARR